jgi:hypothetical protein
MHVPSSLMISFGLRSLLRRPTVRVGLTTAELPVLTHAVEREAASAKQEENPSVAGEHPASCAVDHGELAQ